MIASSAKQLPSLATTRLWIVGPLFRARVSAARHVNAQDMAGGVLAGKDVLDVGAGDQSIMFSYASDEIKDCMP